MTEFSFVTSISSYPHETCNRLLIDVDFRSGFEIARQTNAYKALLQSLPFVFVGKSYRISQVVSMVSEAARQSLKKKGMHFPPWRKADYMRGKWLSSYTRCSGDNSPEAMVSSAVAAETEIDCSQGIELNFEEKFLASVNSSFSSPLKSVAGNDDVAEVVEKEAKVITG